MDKIRCKFICRSVEKVVNQWKSATTGEVDHPFTYTVKMQPVYGNTTDASDENKKFWQWTPAGSLEFTSINCDQFVPGQEYYLDITPAVMSVEKAG